MQPEEETQKAVEHHHTYRCLPNHNNNNMEPEPAQLQQNQNRAPKMIQNQRFRSRNSCYESEEFTLIAGSKHHRKQTAFWTGSGFNHVINVHLVKWLIFCYSDESSKLVSFLNLLLIREPIHTWHNEKKIRLTWQRRSCEERQRERRQRDEVLWERVGGWGRAVFWFIVSGLCVVFSNVTWTQKNKCLL